MIPKMITVFPKLNADDSKAKALANKMDSYIAQWKTDIINLKQLFRPSECPAAFLPELSYFVAAGILEDDSETTQRQKIDQSVHSQRYRGTWASDTKLRIDSITGLNSAIVAITDLNATSDWILSGDGVTESSAVYYSVMGADGSDANQGMDLIGAGDEIVFAGNIYINCHVGINFATLTADQITNIINYLVDSFPVYFVLFLGYIDANGIFQAYSIENISEFIETEDGYDLITEDGNYYLLTEGVIK
jgi:phage tail P2-like protein